MALRSLLFGSISAESFGFNLCYTLFRFYCGISIAIGAGWSKVFYKINPDSGREWDNLAFGVPDWFVQQVGDIGFTFISPALWAYVAVYGEFVGGLLIAIGLLTRFSALQMAFQFFVVAFLWYEEPVPFSMYYQQLIFWSFVLIAAMGGGRFSVDHWLANRKTPAPAVRKLAVSVFFLMMAFGSFGQTAPERVSFTIFNPSWKGKNIDIRYFDPIAAQARGYGYDLDALSTHAANMPAGTRVYERRNGQLELAFVLTVKDEGRQFDLSKTYKVSDEQREQVIRDEQNETAARLKKAVNHPVVKTFH